MKERAFTSHNREYLSSVVGYLGHQEPPFVVKVGPYKRRRSIQQKGLYFVWMGEIADATGHTKDEMHEYFKWKFLPPRLIEVGGKAITCAGSTEALNTEQMSDYMERIKAFAAQELNIMLLDPDEWLAAQ
jgi:hypothetical protein